MKLRLILVAVVAAFGLTACPPVSGGGGITTTCGAPTAPVVYAPNDLGDYSVTGLTRWTCTFSPEIALNRVSSTVWLNAVNCASARAMDVNFSNNDLAVINVTTWELKGIAVTDTLSDPGLRSCGWQYRAETKIDHAIVATHSSPISSQTW